MQDQATIKTLCISIYSVFELNCHRIAHANGMKHPRQNISDISLQPLSNQTQDDHLNVMVDWTIGIN